MTRRHGALDRLCACVAPPAGPFAGFFLQPRHDSSGCPRPTEARAVHHASCPLGHISRTRLPRAGHAGRRLQEPHGAADPPARQPDLVSRHLVELRHCCGANGACHARSCRAERECGLRLGHALRWRRFRQPSGLGSPRTATGFTGEPKPDCRSACADALASVLAGGGWNGTSRRGLPACPQRRHDSPFAGGAGERGTRKAPALLPPEGRRGRVRWDGTCVRNQAVRLVSPLRPASFAIAACAAASRAIGTR